MIAIIGAGNVGSGLAAAATKAGHDVVVAASDPASAGKTAANTGATAAASNAEPVQGAEAVVLAVPHGAVAQLVESLGLRPVDAGSLRFARSLEEIAFLDISRNAADGWTWQSHVALVGPTA